MTMKMAPVTKSGCADDVGNTVSSVDAVAAEGDDTELDTGGDGDAEATANTVVVAGSVTSTSAMRSPVQVPRRHSWKSGDGSFGVYWLGKNPITAWSS